jgi:threonylcarbamoyladenosine tRNA methylthiotransferase MtaB
VTRGPIRSRPAEEVMKEAQRLVEAGFKEIVLTGIHTAGYGEDLDHYSFSQLIEDLVKTVPQLPRLRISSIEASQISEHLMDVMKDSRIVVDHLHMPIQSGSDTILKAMRRKYATEFFRERVRLLRERFPEMAITTDVIVGFPGEGEREFQETVDFIREIQFSALHVFPYSIRRGTLAASMKNQVPAETKKARVDTLLDLSTLLEQRYAKKMLGKTLELLVENYHVGTGYVHGYTTNYIKVHVPGRPEMVNTIIPVRITEVTRDVIKGEIA